MTQNSNDRVNQDPLTASTQPSAHPLAALEEKVLFDGTPSWISRIKPICLNGVLGLLVIALPIILKVMGKAVPWWVIATGFVIAIVLAFVQYAIFKSVRYRITTYRIDFERGMMTRKIDSLELWHAEDILFRQSLMERMLGVGTIELLTRDTNASKIVLTSIPNARPLFEQVKGAVLAIKRQRGIIQLDG